MPEPLAVSNIGVPKCPHCLHVPDKPLDPIARTELFLCPECQKTHVILSHEVEYTTFPTAIDPADLNP